MAGKERAIHLDCRVFTGRLWGGALCRTSNNVFDTNNMKLVTNPSKVTCGRCRTTARKMIRILEKFPVLIDEVAWNERYK